MKNMMLVIGFCLMGAAAFCQDINVQLKEANNLEKQLKDVDALAKYKQVLEAEPRNITALVKCTEINCNIGDRQAKKNEKQPYYDEAFKYALQSYMTDSSTADACYIMALSLGKKAELETENKKLVALWRDIKIYSDKALAINAGHARANFIKGKWNYDIVSLPTVKQAEIKIFYKGFGDADIDSATIYMEKCRSIEQYFAPNYLALGKAYKFKKRPAQAVEVFGRLVKLPTRTPNDVAIKAEGQQILSEMQ